MEQEGSLVVAAAAGAVTVAAPELAPTSLAPGFRFHPTDEELVRYYLRRKACGKPFRFQAVTEIDVYKSEPWELAEYSSLKSRDLEWYFFSPVDKKYGNGSRLNRATGQGYWKATGKDRFVRHKSQTIGMKKTLVFHSGRAPDGQRTNWVMHEYRLADEELEKAGIVQDSFVLCRIFQKSGLGPPNGDRYAPFVEEEWDDDIAMIPGGEAEDDVANGDEARVDGNDLDQDQKNNHRKARLLGLSQNVVGCMLDSPKAVYLWRIQYECGSVSESPRNIAGKYECQCCRCRYNAITCDALRKAPRYIENLIEPQSLPFVCKRESSEDAELLSLSKSKRSKHDDPSSSRANGSEDSTITSQDPSTTMMTKTNCSPTLLGFPLLESTETKEGQPSNPPTFDSSNLEKSVPPGYLKFINNLENGILNVSMERETLKIEVMRAQAMINLLQSRVDLLTKENEDMRRIVREG